MTETETEDRSNSLNAYLGSSENSVHVVKGINSFFTSFDFKSDQVYPRYNDMGIFVIYLRLNEVGCRPLECQLEGHSSQGKIQILIIELVFEG